VLGVEIGPKQLQLLHEVIPAATTMAVLINPANPAISVANGSKRTSRGHSLPLPGVLHCARALA
jgi:hypothetical protein